MAGNRMVTLISSRYLGVEDILALRIGKIGICVYFITDGEHVKIGCTHSLSNRLNELQTGRSRPLIPMHTIRAGTQKEALHIESSLHKYFAAKNVVGEWFNISESEIQIAAREMGYELVKSIYKHDKRLKINKI